MKWIVLLIVLPISCVGGIILAGSFLNVIEGKSNPKAIHVILWIILLIIVFFGTIVFNEFFPDIRFDGEIRRT